MIWLPYDLAGRQLLLTNSLFASWVTKHLYSADLVPLKAGKLKFIDLSQLSEAIISILVQCYDNLTFFINIHSLILFLARFILFINKNSYNSTISVWTIYIRAYVSFKLLANYLYFLICSIFAIFVPSLNSLLWVLLKLSQLLHFLWKYSLNGNRQTWALPSIWKVAVSRTANVRMLSALL